MTTKTKSIEYPENMPPVPWAGTVFFLIIMTLCIGVAVHGCMTGTGMPVLKTNKVTDETKMTQAR